MSGEKRSRRNRLGPWVPTVREVAHLAGVSTATVSRVLSGATPVSGDLAEKVREAARSLNYHPNRVARNLRVRGSRFVGVLVPDIGNPFFTAVIAGIEEGLRGQDYSILLANFGDNPARESKLLETLAEENVSGVIFTASSQPSPEYSRLAVAGLPMVAVSRIHKEIETDCVRTDNRGGARAAVQLLLKLEHRAIALINGLRTVSTGREREEGFREAFRCAGIEVDERYVLSTDWTIECGYRAMRRILGLPRRPTALFGGSNLITLGALQAIHELGLEIPREIAVVGFDDMMWAASLRPALTTVAQPGEDVGRQAASLLLDRIKNPGLPLRTVELPTILIVRASCGSNVATSG